jgi:hypothetical protein
MVTATYPCPAARVDRMLDDPHSDLVLIRETIAGIGQRPDELFPLLVDGPSKEVATERIAGQFDVSRGDGRDRP